MKRRSKKNKALTIERGAMIATQWVGSTRSLVVHTVLFVVAFILPFFGVHLDRVLLVVTTLVSLEAIYLAIFIQMTVNKNTEDIEDIKEDVDEIQEDIEDIEEGHEEDQKQDQKLELQEYETLVQIQTTLSKLSKEIDALKKK